LIFSLLATSSIKTESESESGRCGCGWSETFQYCWQDRSVYTIEAEMNTIMISLFVQGQKVQTSKVIKNKRTSNRTTKTTKHIIVFQSLA